jgi:hypothetical protein
MIGCQLQCIRNLAANPTAMRDLKSLFLDNKGAKYEAIKMYVEEVVNMCIPSLATTQLHIETILTRAKQHSVTGKQKVA